MTKLAGVALAFLQLEAARPLDDNPAPAYPEAAQRKLVAGNVTFRAAVSSEGLVEEVLVLEAPERGLGFEDAVSDAVRHWRFEPARKEGAPVASYYLGRVPFTLRPDEEAAIGRLVERASRLWNAGAANELADSFHPQASVLAHREAFRGRTGCAAGSTARIAARSSETKPGRSSSPPGPTPPSS